MHALLNDDLDKVLCRMRRSLMHEKESFMHVKKVLNFIQSLTNEKKVIKSLMAFQFDMCSLTI